MKKFNKYIILALALMVVATGCRKSDSNLTVDMSDYPQNITPGNDIDSWVTQNLTNPYNIQVVYRFDRARIGDDVRNVSPVSVDKIQPVLRTVLNVFVNPYVKIAGAAFCKKYFHKEWILYGSYSYNNDNSVILGTSSNARTMTLYNLNSFDTTNADLMKRYMRTVFHEFTHALNQTIPIPPAFQQVSVPDYDPAWTSVSIADANAKGFVSPYAKSDYTEDFAETVAHIVVEGPVWYSNLLNTVGTASLGYTRLKQKETIVYQYMLNNFNVDIYALQTEVRKQLREKYNVQDPADIAQGFAYQLAGNKVNTLTINPAAAHYTTYGTSAAFNTLYTNYKNAISALGGRILDSIQFVFPSSSKMIFRAYYRSGTSNFAADYDFTYTISTTTGLVTFSKSMPEGTGSNYANTSVSPAFEQHILPYLINRQFIADYLPATLPAGSPLYRSFAGFYVSGASTNYFYGSVTFK